MAKIYSPKDAPSLSYDSENCADAKSSPPASYCPSNNTIYVNQSELQKIGTPAGREDNMLIQGDNTAMSVVMSRYTLALQKERGVTLDNPTAAMRTACLTGVGQRKMSDSGNELQLSPGDLDEAVAGILTNGVVASDVNGATVPAGFTRILAFRSGVQNEMDNCYERFK
jgi:predicted metalloprotease